MATIFARKLISDALGLLHDTGVRWPKQQLLDWLNAGQREVCLKRPDALTVNDVFSAQPNSKQTLPADGLRLIDVVNDATTNKIIRFVDRDIIDVHVIDWHGAQGDPEQYVYDLRDPKNFYLYPHPTVPRNINIIYAKAPTAIIISDFDTDNQTIEIDDIYANAILDYMLYRAYIKDSEVKDPGKANTHYTAFLQSLGEKISIDSAIHPAAAKGK
ncbi:DUF6682 family protein [Aliikangiella coralliicola]|uniref:Phage protein n=1 Tax=Aliikangiella coralliicola TaxID=2592383 RepID=A0A545U070_9GAMM|nr:DUF6682 family protein [Aliikangiella coralliicola]TQV82860.1 hypothetical protein FLL46_24125 [Aliikangiella coralliicola]